MPVRIQAPKRKGYEDDAVYDLTAYRTALLSKALKEEFRDDLLMAFDAIAYEMHVF